eukprot:Amastigsp_a176681_27.p2 type:complete len:268 gc:universal Amastigsp_a176681_27:87-890(+)
MSRARAISGSVSPCGAASVSRAEAADLQRKIFARTESSTATPTKGRRRHDDARTTSTTRGTPASGTRSINALCTREVERARSSSSAAQCWRSSGSAVAKASRKRLSAVCLFEGKSATPNGPLSARRVWKAQNASLVSPSKVRKHVRARRHRNRSQLLHSAEKHSVRDRLSWPANADATAQVTCAESMQTSASSPGAAASPPISSRSLRGLSTSVISQRSWNCERCSVRTNSHTLLSGGSSCKRSCHTMGRSWGPRPLRAMMTSRSLS